MKKRDFNSAIVLEDDGLYTPSNAMYLNAGQILRAAWEISPGHWHRETPPVRREPRFPILPPETPRRRNQREPAKLAPDYATRHPAGGIRHRHRAHLARRQRRTPQAGFLISQSSLRGRYHRERDPRGGLEAGRRPLHGRRHHVPAKGATGKSRGR